MEWDGMEGNGVLDTRDDTTALDFLNALCTYLTWRGWTN